MTWVGFKIEKIDEILDREEFDLLYGFILSKPEETGLASSTLIGLYLIEFSDSHLIKIGMFRSGMENRLRKYFDADRKEIKRLYIFVSHELENQYNTAISLMKNSRKTEKGLPVLDETPKSKKAYGNLMDVVKKEEDRLLEKVENLGYVNVKYHKEFLTKTDGDWIDPQKLFDRIGIREINRNEANEELSYYLESKQQEAYEQSCTEQYEEDQKWEYLRFLKMCDP